MQRLVGFFGLPSEIANSSSSNGLRTVHFGQDLLVYGLTPADSALVQQLSGGAIQSVLPLSKTGNSNYEVPPKAAAAAGHFAGLSFGPADAENDSVFVTAAAAAAVANELITIAGRPFLVEVPLPNGEGRALFLGSRDIADLDAELGDRIPVSMFSRFIAYAIALRHLTGDACLQPAPQPYACVIVDDPLLRKRYGHLDMESLPDFTREHRFHLTIAFIPHSWRTSVRRIADMFRHNTGRLSICIHGNDHTGGEFASTNPGFLNYALQTALGRMSRHTQRTQLDCDRVMVFPQGNFSMEAMTALQANRFLAAANTVPYPRQKKTTLTLRDIAVPAVLRYGGFPLFLRKPAKAWSPFDVAAALFFGRPVLIVEHHEIGQEMETLAELARIVNQTVENVKWAGLAEVVEGSYLQQINPATGNRRVIAFANAVRLPETAAAIELEWARNPGAVHRVEAAADRRIETQWDTEPAASKNPGMVWRTKAAVRRRLSEIRDNYLSRNPGLLRAAKGMQRLVWK